MRWAIQRKPGRLLLSHTPSHIHVLWNTHVASACQDGAVVKERNVGSKYGAPMGRITRPLEPNARLHLYRVRLDSGGYDNGGAYWGIGYPLYCAYDNKEGITYLRAADRIAAKALLNGHRFYR